MKKTFSKFFLAPLTVLVLASFAMAPIAEARGGGHGGGGHARAGGGGGGGHARAGGGGGHKQVNNANRDVRANNVRSTSVNNVNNRNVNVNANRNVNVNVEQQPRRVLRRWLGQRLSPGGDGGGGDRCGCGDLRCRRLDGAYRSCWLCAGQLRRHDLPAMRQHLVPAGGFAVRGDQPALLSPRRPGLAMPVPGHPLFASFDGLTAAVQERTRW